jgi:hypothetical protein
MVWVRLVLAFSKENAMKTYQMAPKYRQGERIMRDAFMFLFAFFLVSFTVVWAQAGGSAPAADPWWKGIGLGILNGLVVGVVGYFKSKNDDGTHEAFDVKTFIGTAVVGGVVGGIAGFQHKSFTDVKSWIETSGTVAIAEMVMKAVWRNGSLHVADWIAKLGFGVNATKSDGGNGGAGNPPPPPTDKPSGT